MEKKNCPVDMIALCSTDGSLLPIRFRVETEEHTVQTVQISEVVCTKQISYVGCEAMIYVCKAIMGEFERLLELKYSIKHHRWSLFRVIY